MIRFINQKKRDNDLKEWCDINNLTYVELPFNEGEEEQLTFEEAKKEVAEQCSGSFKY